MSADEHLGRSSGAGPDEGPGHGADAGNGSGPAGGGTADGSTTDGSTTDETEQDPFAVFRPKRGRVVAITLAIAAIVIFTFIGVFINASRIHDFQVSDRVLLASIGWILAALFWRYATIRAVPTREGLTVRNLFTTTRVTWPQVVAMQFGGGMPWPTLELNDTETLAVMAIQRSDGPRSVEEARRLYALVKGLGEARDR